LGRDRVLDLCENQSSPGRGGRDPTYGPDVKLWHGAAPFSLVFKGEGLGMRVSNRMAQSLDNGV